MEGDIFVVSPSMYEELVKVIDSSIMITTLRPRVMIEEEVTERVNNILERQWNNGREEKH